MKKKVNEVVATDTLGIPGRLSRGRLRLIPDQVRESAIALQDFAPGKSLHRGRDELDPDKFGFTPAGCNGMAKDEV